MHYLRTTNPLNPENLAAYPRRLGSNRPNPYQLPGGYQSASRATCRFYENRHCGRTAPPTIATQPPVASPTAVPDLPGPDLPVPVPSAVPTVVPPEVSGITQDLIDRINRFAFPVQGQAPSPPCEKQGKFTTSGETTDLPRTSVPR